MMKKTLLLVLVLSLTTNFLFSQKKNKNATSVIGEPAISEATAEERRQFRLEREELSNAFSQLYSMIDEAKAKTPVFYENVEDIKVLENAIAVWDRVKVQLKNFTSKAKRLEQLDVYFNGMQPQRLEDLNGMISRATQKQTAAENQISKLNNTSANEKKYDASIESLNAQLELVSKEASDLEDVNTSYDVSFSEILAKRNSNKKPSNQLDDSFLNTDASVESKDENLDFLTQETVVQKVKVNFKIDYKNGLQGVINPDTKKVLIPYKKWQIEKYQDGIAKVSIAIESQQICSCRLGNYNASVKEVGYVDNQGNYVDGSRKVITGSFNYQAKLVIAKPGYDANKAKIRDESEKQECIKQGKQWKIEAKRRYL
ncbi:hypothetical protein [Lacinutrix sp. MEBiC02595]